MLFCLSHPKAAIIAVFREVMPWRSEYVNMTINKKETARAMKEDIEALLLPDFSAHTLRQIYVKNENIGQEEQFFWRV